MIKKILLMLAGVVFALVVAAFVVPLFINPNNFREAITRQLERSTGYQVKVDGELSVGILPLAHIRAEKLRVKLPGTNDADAFAKIQVLDVGVRLLPLLNGVVEITGITLENPALELKKHPHGNNWQVQTISRAPTTMAVPKSPKAKEQEAARTLILRNITITGGVVRYSDSATGTSMLLKDLEMKAGMSPVKAKVTAVWNDQPITLEAAAESEEFFTGSRMVPMKFSLDSTPLNITFDGEASIAQFKGKTSVKSPSVTAAMAWASGKKPAAGAPLAFEISGQSECSLTECGISSATIDANGQRLTGNIKAKLAGKPAITADLSAATLDLSPYMAAKQAGFSLISPAHAAEAPWSSAPLGLAVLNAVDANVSLKAERLVANQFVADALLLRVRLNHGGLSADGASAGLYEGRGNFTLNLASDGRMDSLVMLENVQLGPLLATRGIDRFTGRANGRIALKSVGTSQKQMIDNLGGEGKLNVFDGSIRGIDIAGMIRNVKSAFTDAGSSQKTDFSEATGSFTIARGIVTNNDLSIKAPLFRVGGKGTVNLPAYTMDYLLSPQIVESSQGQGGKDKQGLGIPIRIHGPLGSPSYTPDLSGMVQEAIKDPKKFRENLKENLGGIKNLLKGL